MSSTSRSKKLYINGIEVNQSLTFKGWQAGFEYTKNIYLKNMNTKSIKLTYK